jgi:TPP-dependent pyruvate/acetoin dehydrogenase alpha subunit
MFITRATSEGLISDSEVAALRDDVKKEVEDAVDFAEKSPQPDIASILVDVDSGLLGGK